ncbi:MAG: GWxTD domain-containing protein [Gemmatimonadota bacterium]
MVPAASRAQEQANLALEVNRYYGQEERTLVEGSVEIPFPLLAFSAAGETLRADARVEVVIENQAGEEVYRMEREIRPEAMNEQMANSGRVSTIETFAIYAPPGEYIARARLTDLTSNETHEVSQSLGVPEQHPFFSDVLLSNHIQKDVRLDEGSYLPYLIGTTMFHPSPRGVFYKDSPLLYFYYEVNPETIEQRQGTIDLAMSLRNGSEVVKDFGRREIKVAEGKNFDLGAFNIGGLRPGRYELVVRCTSCPDSIGMQDAFEVRDAQEQLAFMAPPQPEQEGPPLKYYTGLSAAQIDSVVDVMGIWFTSQQRELLGTLNTQGKVQFLNRFWDSLDADPSIGDPATPENEAKEIFERRVAYADQFFTSSQRLGRDTDRGRIYLLFGEPTERIDRPVEATLGPYQIWNYSNQGATFAFGDFRRDGDYRLIYSTDERFPGDPQIQTQVDQVSLGRESFLPGGRGYERIIEDIRTYRTTTGFQP